MARSNPVGGALSKRRPRTRSIAHILVALLLAATTVVLTQQPLRSAGHAGALDPTFGTAGTVTTAFDARSDAFAVVVQGDGRLVAGGRAFGGSLHGGFTFARYMSDGSLDTTFGTDGTVSNILVDPSTGRYVEAMALQADGKIIGVGFDGTGFALVRLNTDGSLDMSFDTDGLVTTVPGGQAKTVALQADGKIVVAGTLGGEFALARYNPDGSFDTGFDGDGLVTTVVNPGQPSPAIDVVIQSDGKIVAAGTTNEATSALADAVLVRYNTDGSLDTSFDDDGLAFTNLGVAGVNALALQPDGKIVAVGYASSPDWDWALLRYNVDGSLDTSFGVAGVVTTGFGAFAQARDVVLESDGRIVVAGWVRVSASPWTYEFLLARYNSDGSLDTGFGDSGIVRPNPSLDLARGMARQSDGRIVVVGSTGEPQFAVARFLTDANVAPVATADGPYSVLPGGTAGGNVLDNDSDVDGNPLTAVKVSDPTQGAVTLGSDGSFVYTADVSFRGTDSFTYAANDGLENSNVVEVSFVGPPNAPPEANPDGPHSVLEGGSFSGNVLDNDSDADGDALTATKVSDPAQGTLTIDVDGAFTYTPTSGFVGVDSFTYKANDGIEDSNVAEVSIVVGPVPDDVGLVDPTTGIWHLRDGVGKVTSFYYGNPGDVPFTGDWDCDGIDTPGLFRESDAFAYLRNENSQGIAEIRFFFGNPSDVPLAGDFNGDGCDTLSIYRPFEARFYVVNKLGSDNGGLGAADFSFLFGNPGDKPVVGDWDGDGIDEVGLHRESTGFFYWRNTLTTGSADGSIFIGDPGDQLVAGDWGIVDEEDTPAVYRPSDTTFYFRHTLTQGNADTQFTWSGAGSNWIPIAGNFGRE